ncbi:MAG: aldo/keto reductase [bacterium]|nr:aldo/keto reductase [bacterium]
MQKLALGTAQFGMDYGINNTRGRVPADEVLAILNEARKAGVDTLDTAAGYGESEKVLGVYLKQNRGIFKIISKLSSADTTAVKQSLAVSLDNLGQIGLYGYLIHNFTFYQKNPHIWDLLGELKSQGTVKKIGFSLYYPAELDNIFSHDLAIDLVQLPYNVLDQRFYRYFPELKKRKIEIHIRSVFLQGLLFKKPEELSLHFQKIVGKIKTLRDLAVQNKSTIAEVCLNFVCQENMVDKVVVGVDSLANFQEILQAVQLGETIQSPIAALRNLAEVDESLIVPMNWKK